MTDYSAEFYDRHAGGMRASARTVLPLVFDLLAPATVRSVVDVGCGEGHWLAAARELGVPDILGLDGDYVRRDRLAIPADRFRPTDLTNPPAPPTLGRAFDLAICLEVGEHLPDAHAATLVDFVCSLAPVVLFSAAIPGQGGTGHLNEQWPPYWANLFAQRARACADALRPILWENDTVEWWYAQNAMLFIDRAALDRSPRLHATLDPPQRLVHPSNFGDKIARMNKKKRTLSRRLRAWLTRSPPPEPAPSPAPTRPAARGARPSAPPGASAATRADGSA